MLQQTQVATVIPYYERFLKRFPHPAALARASEGEVLRHWQGLGYYRRALNLHRAAKQIAADGGVLPDSMEKLMKLPGVGRYTAGAIASVAFDRKAAAVDGNVARVLSRLFHITESVTDRDTIERIWSLAEELLPAKRCGDFNQALMDLGSAVCVPGRPRCGVCPLANVCKGRRNGSPESLPRKTKRQPVPEVHRVVAVVRSGQWYLIERRPTEGLWAGLWEFPNIECSGLRSRRRALRRLLARYDMSSRKIAQLIGTYRHRLSHRLIHFHTYSFDTRARGGNTAPNARRRWVTERGLKRLAMSTACRRVYALVEAAC